MPVVIVAFLPGIRIYISFEAVVIGDSVIWVASVIWFNISSISTVVPIYSISPSLLTNESKGQTRCDDYQHCFFHFPFLLSKTGF